MKSQEIRIDGSLLANGNPTSSTSSGGGSGGSVWITADTDFSGTGLVSASGGAGGSLNCGSGGGGRIAVYADSTEHFVGQFNAAGGSGQSSGPGGPGSIFFRENRAGEPFEKLIVDNRNAQTKLYFTLSESWYEGSIDEIDLGDNVLFQLKSDESKVIFDMRKVVGDGSALVHIHQNQTVIIERVLEANGTTGKTYVNIRIDPEGEAIMSSRTQIVGKGTAHVALELYGKLTGVQDLVLGDDRIMRVYPTADSVAIVGGDDGEPGKFTFASVEMASGSRWEFAGNMGAFLTVGTMDVKFGAGIWADFFEFTAFDIDVEVGALLSCRGNERDASSDVDQLIGSGNTGGGVDSGAGHGSCGGVGNSLLIAGGKPYGSLYYPKEKGSRGTLTGGRGGGTVYIISAELIVDGEVSASAGDGMSSHKSGGSGGSILIQTTGFEGYGLLSANGGDGSGNGGGGSGGRIAVYTNITSEYGGEYSTLGGKAYRDSSLPAGGGSGTVFLQELRNGLPFKRLFVDNQNRIITQYVALNETDPRVYEFDEVHLPRKSSIHISEEVSDGLLVIHKVLGDRTGLLHAHDSHRFIIEVVESIPTVIKAPVNFIIDRGAEIVFPATLYVIGQGVPTENSAVASLEYDGLMTNVANLIINQGATVQVRPGAHTAIMENGTYVAIGEPGIFQFGSVLLLTESTLNFAPDMGMVFSTSELHGRYASTISAEHIELQSSSLNIEEGASLTCSASDRPDDTTSEPKGKGRPASGNSGGGGGGHANRGGTGYDSSGNPAARGGVYYGSLYNATERGSDGGSGPTEKGGEGAGYIGIKIAGRIQLDGNIKADASTASAGTSGGGGSGGSIRIETKEFDGHGLLTAQGGDGDGSRSGGGSGGRVAIYTQGLNHFQGSYMVQGGSGGSGQPTPHGEPGSVYLQELHNDRPYDKLFIDNSERSWSHYFTLDEAETDDYAFDEIHMTRMASLQMASHVGQKNLTVKMLVGDLSGLLHMHANHTYAIDVEENSKTTIKAQVNLRIDPGAIAAMATTVDIIGTGEPALLWNGQLLGVRNLRIAYKRSVEILAEAHTALIVDGAYEYIDNPGTFRFASLEFGAQSSVVFPPPLGISFNVGFLVSSHYLKKKGFLSQKYMPLDMFCPVRND